MDPGLISHLALLSASAKVATFIPSQATKAIADTDEAPPVGKKGFR